GSISLDGVMLTIQADTTNTALEVTSIKLPVYRSFQELSDQRIHLSPGYIRYAELNYGDQVTVLEEKLYAARIRTTDGSIEGWVHKDYLKSSVMNQTWLVKEMRNVRSGPDTTFPVIRTLPDHSKVYVLDYNAGTNFYLIQTDNGLQGWIYGLYIDYKEGNNLIQYEFDKEGAVTNKITIFTPLNTVANITADEINRFINFKTGGATTLMTGMGSAFIEAQNVSGLNAVYLLAHAGHETGWGKSGIVQNKYNYYGIGAIDSKPMEGAYGYTSPYNGIVAGAMWINRSYVSRDQYQTNYAFPQPTLDNMRFDNSWHQYATDEAWASKIANFAKEFYDFTFKNGEVLKTGWIQNESGKYYFDEKGRMLTGTHTISGMTYHFFANGFLSWNWQYLSGKWYVVQPDGSYFKGWILDRGKWYYLNQKGEMQTSWAFVNGKWYYLNSDGSMATGWVNPDGKWYYLNPNGDMATGWVNPGGKWHYLNPNGDMATGWINPDGKWYYLYSNGHMAVNTNIGPYRIGPTGAML
ncbi:glucosaminidase domain-containing protein, partial [Neobacillus niacini]|uniref:glucosaminidase domain-containing protein n=1 Tax=Neobacillus niacini TaxID=86668 RepID=UPI0030008F7A